MKDMWSCDTHVNTCSYTKLQGVGSLLYLSGELWFIKNSGGEGGALQMESFSQAVLNRGLHIFFEENSGR